MPELQNYLQKAVADHASDLFFIAGCPISEKVDGHILPLEENKLTPADTQGLIHNIYTLSGRSIDRYLETGDDDFSFALPGISRFRVNTYRQRNSFAAVVRVVSFDIPKWEEINIPPQVMDIADITHGMILFTGTAGSGKSTTQACIIDRINRTRDCHIITLEDPIEYLHKNQRSIVSQREIAIDTADYLSALRSCLRQAPDVILLGEMRDAETIRTAITAAETGHMVIATMHTKGAVNAIDRVIDSFSGASQSQIRFQLATVLRTVVSQQMVPDVSGNNLPVFEVMQINGAIRTMIRDNKNYQIENAILAGQKDGMLSMDNSILALYRAKKISKETALNYADHPDQLIRHLN
ncbi:MAG: PilT/PilU family type 4a pilus ATPase [Ruminococcaceae bacterium]|nr:PilT/PilU family type 4a pilus ATPase [Oscillospiraceae bacterium]